MEGSEEYSVQTAVTETDHRSRIDTNVGVWRWDKQNGVQRLT
jgi:hypothetical protein